MCLVISLNFFINIFNYLLVFSIVVLLLYLWFISVISVGVIVIVVSLFFRLNGMV